MKKCPKCGGVEFFVTANVTQGWKVDANGNYIETTAECEEVTHKPDNEDVWQCATCGHDAPGEEFEA